MTAPMTPRERPILFSGEMVKAILDGRKTQTRRVVKDDYLQKHPDWFECPMVFHGLAQFNTSKGPSAAEMMEMAVSCPYGQPGDRLWVREQLRGDGQPGNRRKGIMRYGADGEMVLAGQQDWLWEYKRPVLPSIHMPRWTSRILLEVVSVKVERVQDIKENDAIAEGAMPRCLDDLGGAFPTYYRGFQRLWDSINAKRGYGWDKNPWVWCITFRRLGWDKNPWVWCITFRRLKP